MTVNEDLAYLRGWEDSLQTILCVMVNLTSVEDVTEKILKIMDLTKNKKLVKIREKYGELTIP